MGVFYSYLDFYFVCVLVYSVVSRFEILVCIDVFIIR